MPSPVLLALFLVLVAVVPPCWPQAVGDQVRLASTNAAGVEFPGSRGQLLALVMEGSQVHARERQTNSHNV